MSFLTHGQLGDYLFLFLYLLLVEGTTLAMALRGTIGCPRDLSTTVFGSTCNAAANWRKVSFQHLAVYVIVVTSVLLYHKWYISLSVFGIIAVVSFIQSAVYTYRIEKFKEKEKMRKEERYQQWLRESGQDD